MTEGMSSQFQHLNRRALLKDYAYTVLFCALIGVLLTVIGVSDSLTVAMVISYAIGLSICTVIMALLHTLRPNTPILLWLLILFGVVLGSFIGWNAGSLILNSLMEIPFGPPGKDFLRAMVLGAAFGLVISYFSFARSKLAAARALTQEERIRRLSSEKEALEANLRLLQAQIEPHFLFNTLSNIHSLMDTDPGTAKAMLVDFMQYLRTSLLRSRDHMTTLGREIEALEAYLRLFRVRMGERLRYTLDIPEPLKPHAFPPMLLQPLVENALKHGLEPEVEGGGISIRARGENGILRIQVEDTGRGFAGETGSGVGLQNVRERLGLLYGEAGRLRLEENRPRGVRAVLEVPL
jgi:hypothetical protein